jgi:hypothetical protein
VKLVEVIVRDELELTRNPAFEKIWSENTELSMVIVLFAA